MKPLLSVVIPCLRAEAALERTLESWSAAQAAGWAELIVQDATPGATSEHALGFRRFAEADAGIYDAMNRGLGRTQGEWVLFAGTGDVLVDGDSLKRALERGKAPLQVFGTVLAPPREPGVPEAYLARWDAGLKWRHVVHHQGVCYRVSALSRAPFDVQWKVLADYALHLKLWEAGTAAQCHETTALEVAPGGVSRRFDAALYAEEWRMKRAVLGRGEAAIQLPWLLAKWAYKRTARWR
jgi:glycosyltransferase involved in cell wall biosynthesis